MCQRSGLVHLVPEEAAIGRAAQWRRQLLETGSDPTQSLLGTLTVTLLPPPCSKLVHWTTPPTHDVITHLSEKRVKGVKGQTGEFLKLFLFKQDLMQFMMNAPLIKTLVSVTHVWIILSKVRWVVLTTFIRTDFKWMFYHLKRVTLYLFT